MTSPSMRILLLTQAFNSLTQRLWAELRQAGHAVSVEFDISNSVTEEAVALFAPDLIVAPYLRRAIPESVWSRHVCLIVHPGIVGDRINRVKSCIATFPDAASPTWLKHFT